MGFFLIFSRPRPWLRIVTAIPFCSFFFCFFFFLSRFTGRPLPSHFLLRSLFLLLLRRVFRFGLLCHLILLLASSCTSQSPLKPLGERAIWIIRRVHYSVARRSTFTFSFYFFLWFWNVISFFLHLFHKGKFNSIFLPKLNATGGGGIYLQDDSV